MISLLVLTWKLISVDFFDSKSIIIWNINYSSWDNLCDMYKFCEAFGHAYVIRFGKSASVVEATDFKFWTVLSVNADMGNSCVPPPNLSPNGMRGKPTGGLGELRYGNHLLR